MEFLLIAPVLLMSIVLHEVAHAWVAHREGDDTAYKMGRITLNPLSHIDPVGSILVPAGLFFFGGGLLFGWAKAVPVNPRNYRDYRGGDIRVSMAGIVVNLILAVIFALAIVILVRFVLPFTDGGGFLAILFQALDYGLQINLVLAIFNLIPLPPLDGSHVLYHFLPPAIGAKYRDFGRYGIAVLFILVAVAPGALTTILTPVSVIRNFVLAMALG